MKRIPKSTAVAAVIILAAWSICANAKPIDARTFVVNTINEIDASLDFNISDEQEFYDAAKETVEVVLQPILNVDKFSKLILASHWKKASPEQRENFSNTLTQVLCRTLVTAIVDFRTNLIDIEKNLTILDAKPGRRESQVSVPILITGENNTTRSLDFRLNTAGEDWKIYDVVFEGVSFAINYRTIINSEIKKSNLDHVTANLQSKLNPN